MKITQTELTNIIKESTLLHINLENPWKNIMESIYKSLMELDVKGRERQVNDRFRRELEVELKKIQDHVLMYLRNKYKDVPETDLADFKFAYRDVNNYKFVAIVYGENTKFFDKLGLTPMLYNLGFGKPKKERINKHYTKVDFRAIG